MACASLLTGASRAAVATIAVRGRDATRIVLAAFDSAGSSPIQIGQVRYGTWHGGEESGIGESVVVSRNDDFEAEQIVEESWEIHCHGGAVAASRILEDLQRLGAQVADPWTLGTADFCSGIPSQLSTDREQDLLRREATEVLAHTVSVRTAAIALDQTRGAMKGFVLESLTRLDDATATDLSVIAQIAEQARKTLRYSSLGLHLSTPWRVVLAGQPNVGKSSLINALLGYRRSITVDQPGTTRDILEAQTVIDGWPIRLSDTAGIRDDADCAIETAGIESAKRELETADLILWVQDASAASHPSTDRLSEFVGKPIIQILNKIDRIAVAANGPLFDSEPFIRRVNTSATTGVGIEHLRLAISETLVPDVPPPASLIPITPRQVSLLQDLTMATSRDAMVAILRKLSR